MMVIMMENGHLIATWDASMYWELLKRQQTNFEQSTLIHTNSMILNLILALLYKSNINIDHLCIYDHRRHAFVDQNTICSHWNWTLNKYYDGTIIIYVVSICTSAVGFILHHSIQHLLSFVDFRICIYRNTISNYTTRQNDAIDSNPVFCVHICIRMYFTPKWFLQRSRLKKCKFICTISLFMSCSWQRQVTMRQVD